MGYIQSLDIPFLYRLVKVAREKEKDKEYLGMYFALLPYMDKTNFRLFSEWKKMFEVNKVNYDFRSKDELMADIYG